MSICTDELKTAKSNKNENNGETKSNKNKNNGETQSNENKGVQQIENNENEFDWREFEREPLKSVDLTELRKQRTPEQVEKLARVLFKYKHLLSDGTLDFRTNPTVKHSTTCTIRTTEENPK